MVEESPLMLSLKVVKKALITYVIHYPLNHLDSVLTRSLNCSDKDMFSLSVSDPVTGGN